MVKLTRLDGEKFILNAELIKYVEQRPDTFITLSGNERIVVTESPDDVIRLVIDYHRSTRLLPEEVSANREVSANNINAGRL